VFTLGFSLMIFLGILETKKCMSTKYKATAIGEAPLPQDCNVWDNRTKATLRNWSSFLTLQRISMRRDINNREREAFTHQRRFELSAG